MADFAQLQCAELASYIVAPSSYNSALRLPQYEDRTVGSRL